MKILTGFLTWVLAAIAVLLNGICGSTWRWAGVYGLGVAVTPDLGHGVVVTFSSSFLARLLSLEWTGLKREAVETTDLATSGGKTFMPGDNYDPGELKGQIQFDTDATPPIAGAAETVTVTFPDAETWAASGFMTEFDISGIENDTVMVADFTIKLSGTITF